jgi:hypothetical protein
MTEHSDDGWHFIGKHTVRFEPPDIVFFRVDGDTSVAQAKQLMQYVAALPKPEKGLFGLLDVAKAGRHDPAALKIPGTKEHMRLHRAVVYINARFHHRTLVGLFQRVTRLLKLTSVETPIIFVDTEAEARAWLDEYRRNN